MKTTLVALVVVPRNGRYLIVEERDGSWYLPAGRVEPGESLTAAAARETIEEAGVQIELEGLLGMDHQWAAGRTRLRFAFVARAVGAADPKSTPDEHTRSARWASKSEIATLPLRDPEVLTWIERYERASALLPIASYEWFGAFG
jgi:phosphatase NudJ